MQLDNQIWDAEDYAKNSLAQLQWAQELIAKLALLGNESLLDVGCGDGKISAQLSKQLKNGYVVGIDRSEAMIKLAAETYPKERCRNLSFQCMDATNIRLDRSFDVAFSNAVLHWVKDHVAVLTGLRGCLKDGAKILLQMGGYGNAVDIFSAISSVTQSSRYAKYYEGFVSPYYFYAPEEYQEWLSSTGFRAERVELIPKDMRHQGEQGLMGWLRTTWFPYTDRLPIDQRHDFLSEVVAAYTAEHPVDAQGDTNVKMIRLEVEAYAI